MSRLIAALMVLLAVASAFVLYAVTYDTRRMEQNVAAQSRSIEATRLDIAVLKAERAYLSRPERIEEIVRKNGLGPIDPRQVELMQTTGERKSLSEGERKSSPEGERR